MTGSRPLFNRYSERLRPHGERYDPRSQADRQRSHNRRAGSRQSLRRSENTVARLLCDFDPHCAVGRRKAVSAHRRLCCLDFHGVGVRHAASSAFKDIMDIKVLKTRRSSERHNSSAAWAMRRPWRVFSRMFVAHARHSVLKPQMSPDT